MKVSIHPVDSHLTIRMKIGAHLNFLASQVFFLKVKLIRANKSKENFQFFSHYLLQMSHHNRSIVTFYKLS